MVREIEIGLKNYTISTASGIYMGLAEIWSQRDEK